MRDDEPFPQPEEGSAVAIGVFDGVHLGHRHVLADTRRLAAEHRAVSAVLTFDRHPASVVRPDSAPLLLTDLEQRLELLADTGVDLTYVVSFDEVRAKESAEDFVVTMLVDGLRARAVTVGADFHFGHRRRGDVALLTAMGQEHGFEVDGIDLVASKSARARAVSSTAIRSALAAGDVDEANRMLGRLHEVRGVVQPGDQRGRDLGFPTANVAVPGEIQLPADGIYAGWYVRPDGSEHRSAISLGRRPTFYEKADASLLEVHLLDFEGDLYGEAAKVRFAKHLRGEARFESVDELCAQIGRDVEDTRAALG